MRTKRGDNASPGHQDEYAIGGGDQPPGKGDPLRLVGIEQAGRRGFLQHGGKLPRKVHGVADAGVHPLATDRAVDVRRISQQKRASSAEVVRDAVMDPIGREPIQLHDVELEVLDRLALHVVERQLAGFAARQVAHGSDQAQAARSLEGKDDHEIGIFEIEI